MHWLQDKNRIILEMNGIHWHDYFMMEKFFLDNNDFITTKQATMSLLVVELENAKQILYKNSTRMKKKEEPNLDQWLI